MGVGAGSKSQGHPWAFWHLQRSGCQHGVLWLPTLFLGKPETRVGLGGMQTPILRDRLQVSMMVIGSDRRQGLDPDPQPAVGSLGVTVLYCGCTLSRETCVLKWKLLKELGRGLAGTPGGGVYRWEQWHRTVTEARPDQHQQSGAGCLDVGRLSSGCTLFFLCVPTMMKASDRLVESMLE